MDTWLTPQYKFARTPVHIRMQRSYTEETHYEVHVFSIPMKPHNIQDNNLDGIGRLLVESVRVNLVRASAR